jgi:putative transposase
MNAESSLPIRKYPTHVPPVERFNTPIVLFLTVCIDQHHSRLADTKAHEVLDAIWRAATAWRVSDYLIMPDHVHLFCTPGQNPPTPLKDWVAYWKRMSCRSLQGTPPFWQRSFWDTQMRNAEHYAEKLSYVRMNPVRKGLVAKAECWPYQGRVFELRW